MTLTITKVCTKCRQEKERAEFYKNPRYGGGYVTRCKECTAAYKAKWRRENREFSLETGKLYRNKFRKILRIKDKLFYYKNKEKINARHRAVRSTDEGKKRLKSIYKTYYMKNREKILASRREAYVKKKAATLCY